MIVPTQFNFIPPSPYQGLFAFGEKDAEFFFGREKFVESLVEVVHQQPLIMVIGSSGSGKSSAVFAGLIPHLRLEDTWLIESFRPSDKPFYQLASALVRQLDSEISETKKLIEAAELAEKIQEGKITLPQVLSPILQKHPNKNFLLVIDQFEEIYTLCQSKEIQKQFVDTFLEAVNKKTLTLVLTLRADFCDYVLSYLIFGNALQQNPPQFIVAMSREQLIAAIEKPAKKLKVQLQVHLTERILDDVGHEPGNLPLLEFALTELWKKQQNRELTHKAYDEIGGVKQALVKQAEDVYYKLSESEQQAAKHIFLSLIQLGEGTEATRRQVLKRDLISAQYPETLINQVVQQLADRKLIVTSDIAQKNLGIEHIAVIDMAHEALIRHWPLLRQWLDENQDWLRQLRKIETVAQEWYDRGKSNEYLLEGRRLDNVKDFCQEQKKRLTLSNLAEEFIQKSIQYRWVKRFQTSTWLTIPVLISYFLILPYLQQQGVTEAWNKIRTGNKEIREEIEYLTAGCWARQKLRWMPQYIAELFFGVCADFRGVDLSAANLMSVDLHSADLRSVKLRNANLRSANLTEADLSFTDLREADLSYANLRDAKLINTNLRSAKGMTATQLNQARLCYVSLPEKINVDPNHNCTKP
ncbi:MAG: pentapeptide repeat-containing protein [Aulosira sp. DedQUE10]|nr:pentapeptide repeat-containing protein [Aulosira sp. DedQUE10]